MVLTHGSIAPFLRVMIKYLIYVYGTEEPQLYVERAAGCRPALPLGCPIKLFAETENWGIENKINEVD